MVSNLQGIKGRDWLIDSLFKIKKKKVSLLKDDFASTLTD